MKMLRGFFISSYGGPRVHPVPHYWRAVVSVYGTHPAQRQRLKRDARRQKSTAKQKDFGYGDNDPNQYLPRSRYDSANDTANAPVQLVSHAEHVYVFRHSTRGTLLVDRFVVEAWPIPSPKSWKCATSAAGRACSAAK